MSNDILHSFARAPPCGCTRHPQCKPVSTLRFELYQPMTPALPVDKRSLQHVAVLWAARASHRLLTLVVVVLRPKAQGCVNYLVSGQWGLLSLWLACRTISSVKSFCNRSRLAVSVSVINRVVKRAMFRRSTNLSMEVSMQASVR